MDQLRGKLRQKQKDGPYYYRLTVFNGKRKEFALKTCDFLEACQKAAELDSVWEAPTKEVAIAQINAIKGFSKQAHSLPLKEAWNRYEASPDRAHPLEHEHLAYKATLNEFLRFVTGEVHTPGKRALALSSISEVDYSIVSAFVEYLKSTDISVHTHNRKIKRLRKIFSCLSDYYEGDNPFDNKGHFRKDREEQNDVVRRVAFTKEQEEALREVLDNPAFEVMNKPEIKVIFYLGMYTGQRLKDCVLLQWQNVDLERNRIWVTQFKTGKKVSILIAPQLLNVLNEALTWKTDQYVTPKCAARYNRVNRVGKNVGNNVINLDVLRVIRWIGVETSVKVKNRKKKMTVYGFHSLRHSFCSFCAEAGVPLATVQSIIGSDSDIINKYYTHVGDEAQQQAILAIADQTQSVPLKDRVQKVLLLLHSKPEPSQNVLDQIEKLLTD